MLWLGSGEAQALIWPVGKWGVGLPEKAVSSGPLFLPMCTFQHFWEPAGQVTMPWFTDTELIPSGELTQPDSAEPLTPGLGSILTPGPAGFRKSLPFEGPIQRPEHGVGHWLFPGGEGRPDWDSSAGTGSLDVSAAGPLPLNYKLSDKPWGPWEP